MMPIRTPVGSITSGLHGRKSTNADKLEEEWIWGETNTMLGFTMDSESLTIRLPEANIAGALALFDQLRERPTVRRSSLTQFNRLEETPITPYPKF